MVDRRCMCRSGLVGISTPRHGASHLRAKIAGSDRIQVDAEAATGGAVRLIARCSNVSVLARSSAGSAPTEFQWDLSGGRGSPSAASSASAPTTLAALGPPTGRSWWHLEHRDRSSSTGRVLVRCAAVDDYLRARCRRRRDRQPRAADRGIASLTISPSFPRSWMSVGVGRRLRGLRSHRGGRGSRPGALGVFAWVSWPSKVPPAAQNFAATREPPRLHTQ